MKQIFDFSHRKIFIEENDYFISASKVSLCLRQKECLSVFDKKCVSVWDKNKCLSVLDVAEYDTQKARESRPKADILRVYIKVCMAFVFGLHTH